MGQINIKAWGSMDPETDGGPGKTFDINHDGSYADTVNAARRALDEIEASLRHRLGGAAYEAAPDWAPKPAALTSSDIASGGGLSA